MSTPALALLAFALPLSLFAAAFVIGLFEKHPVQMFRNDPGGSVDPYMLAMVRSAAAEWGFRWRDFGIHTRFATLHAALLVSPDSTTLAIVGTGTILGIPSKKTILLSRLRDGGALLTIDEAGTAELDPATRRTIRMNADFAELWTLHAKILSEQPGVVVPFGSEPTWADVDAIYAARVERMVQAGNARYSNAERTQYRYTPAGAFKASIVHGIKQTLTPRNLLRQFKSRPGTKVRNLPVASPIVAPSAPAASDQSKGSASL